MSSLHLTIRPDAVAVLTLDQPGSKANVLNADLWTEFEATIDSLATRTELRGLVIASAKPDIFIAGADLKVLAAATGPDDPTVRQFLEQGLRTLGKLEALPWPTIAAIDGAALGGGLEVALACDFRIAGPNPKTRLGLPEVTLGLIPGWGGTQRLPRLVGIPTALEMLVTGQAVTETQARASGLVEGQVAGTGDLVDIAARYLLDHPGEPAVRGRKRSPSSDPVEAAGLPIEPDEPAAVREVRRVVQDSAGLKLDEGLKLETEAFLRLAGSEDSRQRIAAFFSSRKRS
jgi:enoyl-CoA hydratase/carnithine racemase